MKKFVPWTVCDQDKNKCPTLEELNKIIHESYDDAPWGYEFEISLVKENNEFGKQSCGWEDENKIVLFDNEDYNFESVEELYKFLVKAYKRAEKKCNSMNLNKENHLY